MRILLKAFCSDESGVTAIEYGVLVAILSGSLLIALPAASNGMNATFATVESALAAPLAVPAAKAPCTKGGGGSKGGRR